MAASWLMWAFHVDEGHFVVWANCTFNMKFSSASDGVTCKAGSLVYCSICPPPMSWTVIFWNVVIFINAPHNGMRNYLHIGSKSPEESINYWKTDKIKRAAFSTLWFDVCTDWKPLCPVNLIISICTTLQTFLLFFCWEKGLLKSICMGILCHNGIRQIAIFTVHPEWTICSYPASREVV